MPSGGGRRGRKVGNKAKKPSFRAYWSSQKGYANRAELHRARRVARFNAMVAESRAAGLRGGRLQRSLERARVLAGAVGATA